MTATTKDAWAAVIKGKPAVGQVAERTRTTRIEDIEAFTAMTGDRNPLHYDRALAENTSFGRLIVQGGVTSGILNAVVAEDLPGPGTVFSASNGSSSRRLALTRRSPAGSRSSRCATTSRSAGLQPRSATQRARIASPERRPSIPCRSLASDGESRRASRGPRPAAGCFPP